MQWDKIWKRGLPRQQLELVVDNQTLANLANGEASVSNEYYRAPLDRIRMRLLYLFQHVFDYKADFLDPVDWRPREFNATADHAANCILQDSSDVDTRSQSGLLDTLNDAVAVQIFSDGGYANNEGAAAFVLTSVHDRGNHFETVIIGARGILMKNARSAFHAEVTALDIATEFLLSMVHQDCEALHSQSSKRAKVSH